MVTVRLRHFLSDDGNPEDRGNITVQSIRTGSVALSQAGLLPHHISRLKVRSYYLDIAIILKFGLSVMYGFFDLGSRQE